MYNHLCPVCDSWFKSTRPHKKTCSDRCRMKQSRANKGLIRVSESELGELFSK